MSTIVHENCGVCATLLPQGSIYTSKMFLFSSFKSLRSAVPVPELHALNCSFFSSSEYRGLIDLIMFYKSVHILIGMVAYLSVKTIVRAEVETNVNSIEDSLVQELEIKTVELCTEVPLGTCVRRIEHRNLFTLMNI